MKEISAIIFLLASAVTFGQVTDNFDSYEATVLAGQGSWLSSQGTIGVYVSSGDGEAYPAASATESASYYSGTFTDNQYAQLTITAIAAQYIGPAVRASADNYYAYYSNSATCYLMKIVDGVATELDASGTPFQVGDVVKLVAYGDTLFCYINGVLDTNIDSDGKVTDTDLSSGCPGVGGYGSSNTTRGDSWEGGNYGVVSGMPSQSYLHFVMSTEWWNYVNQNFPHAHFLENVQGEPTYSVGYGYDSTYVLACKQFFAIPEDVNNNDVVGTFQKNRTWRSGNTVTYEIATNHNGAFAIGSTTGIITIADATKIDGKIVASDTAINLVIRTFDSGHGFELDTAEVWVKEASGCVFVDYSQGTNGSGTRLFPERDLDEITITAGKGYFLKRGTAINNESTVIQAHLATKESPTIFAAYGTGGKPIFYNSAAQTFYLGADDDHYDNRVHNVKFYDLCIRDGTNSAINVQVPCDSISLYNLDIWNNMQTLTTAVVLLNDSWPIYDVSDSSRVYLYELVNCNFDTSTVGAAFIKGAPHLIQNCYFGSFTSPGDGLNVIRLTFGTDGIIKHCEFNTGITTVATNERNIQLRMDDVTIEDCIFNDLSDGVYVTTAMVGYNESFPDSLTVRNCLFRGQSSWAINYAYNTSSEYSTVGNVFENNLFDEAFNGIYLRDAYTNIIRRNVFKKTGSTGYAIMSSSYEGLTSTKIYYNLTYGFNYELYVPLSTYLEVYNNTFDGDVFLDGSTNPTIRNIIYESITLPASYTFTTSIRLADIDTDDYFTDYDGHDFTLKSTAADAINQGADVDLTPDLVGTAVDNTPSIGAYEYIP